MVQELDRRCEELLRDDFGEDCNFEIDDAIQKLEKLGIVTRVNANDTLFHSNTVYFTIYC